MPDSDNQERFMRLYVAAVSLVCIVGLAVVYGMPPDSMKTNRDGVDHFTPSVINPETGDPIEMGDLIKHFRGD